MPALLHPDISDVRAIALLPAIMAEKPPASRGSIDIRLAVRVRQMINQVGERDAARSLGISAPGLVRICAGLPILSSTADAIRQRLDAIRERIAAHASTAVDTMNGALAPRGMAVDVDALANAAAGQVSR